MRTMGLFCAACNSARGSCGSPEHQYGLLVGPEGCPGIPWRVRAVGRVTEPPSGAAERPDRLCVKKSLVL